MRKKKEDTTEYVKQWNEELKQELKQSVKAYEELCKKHKQLKEDYNELKAIERQHNKINGELRKEISELQNNRDKAIEYINKNIAIYHKQLPLIAIDYEEVINILRGETNE